MGKIARKITAAIAVVLGVLAFGGIAAAEPADRIIGDWIVSTDDLPRAVNLYPDMIAPIAGFIVGCIGPRRTLELMRIPGMSGEVDGKSHVLPIGAFAAGDRFEVKFRADYNSKIDMAGIAADNRNIEIAAPGAPQIFAQMFRQLLMAKEFFLQVRTPNPAPYGRELYFWFDNDRAAEALADVVKACPLE